MDWLIHDDFLKLWIKLIEQYPFIAILLIGTFTAIVVLWKDDIALRNMLFKELEEEKAKSEKLYDMIQEVKKNNDQ